jgi:hypothetical protein
MTSTPLENLREEDFVEYFLFPNIKACELQNEEELLKNVNAKVLEIAKNYCKNYIWHRDGFKVYPRYRNFNLLNEHVKSTNGK